VPWLKPPEPAVAEDPAADETEEPPLPVDPSGVSPLVPAPDTPGTDSGADVGCDPADEDDESPTLLSPVERRDFKMTRLLVVDTVLFVPAASVYWYALLPDEGPAVEGGS
jgi:hypothetical protein